MDELAAWAGPAVPPTHEELADKHAIGQLAHIYGLGLDLRNYELCRSAFADEAIGIGRNGPQPVNDYLTETYAMASSFHATQHLIAQQLIRVDGDEAVMLADHRAQCVHAVDGHGTPAHTVILASGASFGMLTR